MDQLVVVLLVVLMVDMVQLVMDHLEVVDKILVVDHGQIAEFGTHKELLDQRGIYYKLVMAQARAALEKTGGMM